MALSLSRDIAEAMVQNMLNLEGEEITETMMADCVKEAINMICGNFVRRLDPERCFSSRSPASQWATYRPAGGTRRRINSAWPLRQRGDTLRWRYAPPICPPWAGKMDNADQP
jgi:hypothetical protein